MIDRITIRACCSVLFTITTVAAFGLVFGLVSKIEKRASNKTHEVSDAMAGLVGWRLEPLSCMYM